MAPQAGFRTPWLRLTSAALKQEKPRVVQMLASLAGLALAQSLFLLLIKGFVMAMFAEPTAPVALTDVVSPRIISFWPGSETMLLPREQLAYIVPIAILIAGVLQAIMTYVFQ